MVVRTLSMNKKELREARSVGIPEWIIQRMVREGELSEREKEIVRGYGKIFVSGYMKGNVLVRPQLRNYSVRKMNKYEVTVLFGGFRFDTHYIDAKDTTSARRKVKNKYQKKFRKDVRISKIRPMGREEIELGGH